MKEDVEFYSEGKLVKGTLYVPARAKKSGSAGQFPAIVLCQGFPGIKDVLVTDYAYEFARKGYVALTFDYRGFGESEGERGKLSPVNQVIDIRNALTFLRCLPQTDPERCGLWGTSLGGSNAVVAAGMDSRVRCLVVQLAFADGERVITASLTEAEKEKMEAALMKMWTRAVLTNQTITVPISEILTDEQSRDYYNKTTGNYPQLKISIPFLLVKEIMEYKPERYLPLKDIPMLIVAAENDTLSPLEESRRLYDKAGEPRELYVVKGASHFDLYEGARFKEVVARQVEWFDRYLA